MSEQKHTPEPWAIGRYGEISASASNNMGGRINLDGVTMPMTVGPAMDEAKANARRIVACVNACAGIDTETLEGLAASDRTIANMVGKECVARMRAECQRDQLLEALKEARRAIGDHYAPDHCYATGPLTGNDYRDLVECPACSAIAMYEAAIAAAEPRP